MSEFIHEAAIVCVCPCSRLPLFFFFLPDSGAKLLLVSKERIYDKSRPFLDELPTLKDVWCFDVDFQPRMKVGGEEWRGRGTEGFRT